MNIEDKLPNAERILLTKIIEASPDETYNSIEDEILKVTNDPAHKIIIEAMHEYAKRLLDVVAESATVDDFFDQRDFSTKTWVNKQSILRFKELLK